MCDDFFFPMVYEAKGVQLLRQNSIGGAIQKGKNSKAQLNASLARFHVVFFHDDFMCVKHVSHL